MEEVNNRNRVKEWRKRTGNDLQNKKYRVLRDLGIGSIEACAMKYWGIDKIVNHLLSQGYKVKDLQSLFTFDL